jgi:hypothetical protein
MVPGQRSSIFTMKRHYMCVNVMIIVSALVCLQPFYYAKSLHQDLASQGPISPLRTLDTHKQRLCVST